MEKNEEIFEAYFSGTLSEKEVLAFNQELQTNSDFQNEYNFFLSLKKATALSERDKMRSALQDIDIDVLKEQNSTSKSLKKTILSYLIAFIVILVISFFAYQLLNKKSTPEYLFAQHYEIYSSQKVRGESNNSFQQLYEDAKYTAVINQAATIEKSPEIFMMLGNAYLKAEKFDQAADYFSQISDESSLRDQKYWYLALVQLKLNKITSAKENFKKLQSLSNYKRKEIDIILSELPN